MGLSIRTQSPPPKRETLTITRRLLHQPLLLFIIGTFVTIPRCPAILFFIVDHAGALPLLDAFLLGKFLPLRESLGLGQRLLTGDMQSRTWELNQSADSIPDRLARSGKEDVEE